MDHERALPPDESPIAAVIPIIAASRRRDPFDPSAHRAVAVLDRRYGPSWSLLPAAVGRPAARAEVLLADGPTALDTRSVAPDRAVEVAEGLTRAARDAAAAARDEAEVLGEALGVEVAELPMRAQADLAGAVLELASAPTPTPAWARPEQALAAETVLSSLADDVRLAARLHREMYEQYTDAVWDVSDDLLRSGRTWGHPSRWRLRRALRAASRTGGVPGRLRAASDLVTRTREARHHLSLLAGLLATHLAELDRGPLTDIDAALAALAPVRRLHAALGPALDPQRLGDLLRADAFRSPDLYRPAGALYLALTSWVQHLDEERPALSSDPLDLHLDHLEGWAQELARLLPALVAGNDVTRDLTRPPQSTNELVLHLLAREHVDDVGVDPIPVTDIPPALASKGAS